MKQLITFGVAFFIAGFPKTHAGEPENINQPLYSVFIPNYYYGPQVVATHSANSFPNGVPPTGNQFFPAGHEHDSSNKDNGGSIWNGPTRQPQLYPSSYNYKELNLEDCYDKKYASSCDVEFHGFPKKSCRKEAKNQKGKYPWWNPYPECDYFVVIKRNYYTKVATFYLSGLLDEKIISERDIGNFGFVAVGISNDRDTGNDDDVLECGLGGDGKIRPSHFRADHANNGGPITFENKNDLNDLNVDGNEVKLLYADHQRNYRKKVNLTCIFERPLVQKLTPNHETSIHKNVPKEINLNKGKFYVILAGGHLIGTERDSNGRVINFSRKEDKQISSHSDFPSWRNGCHNKRPSNFLIASAVLLIVFFLSPLRK